jgi:hypothetical protein
MEISASKNKSSFPAKGLLRRRAPLATVRTQPNDSVHHETMRLVSLNFRLRRRMAAVLSTDDLMEISLVFAIFAIAGLPRMMTDADEID